MAMNLVERWDGILQQLHVDGSLRELITPDGLDFCSNDYLGYATSGPLHSGVPDLAKARSGSAARLLRGNHPVWSEVEAELARWHNCAETLMLSSGYCANEGLLATAIGPDDWVASDRLNHASIIDGLRLAKTEKFIYRHCDLEHLEQGLRRAAATRLPGRELFIVTESLFSMDGDLAPLPELAALARQYEAHLIVDEAHATGCFAPTGQGLVDMFNLRDSVLASVHTGGKALAVCGAYICCSSLLKRLLINRCRHFMFTTALPPVIGLWWLETLARVRADEGSREALHDNSRRFRNLLSACGIDCFAEAYIVPVIIGGNAHAMWLASQLQRRGLDVRAIRTPTVPPGTARLRISIHASHTRAQLDQLVEALAEMLDVAPESQ